MQASHAFTDSGGITCRNEGMIARKLPRDARAVGKRITHVREALGQRQAEFARLVGISQQALNNYERGRQRPDIEQAMKICERTGATLDWLYFGDASGLPSRLMPPAA